MVVDQLAPVHDLNYLLFVCTHAIPLPLFKLYKLLRLNKTHWKLPACQADCRVLFSWTRTSTHLTVCCFLLKQHYSRVTTGHGADVLSTRQVECQASCQRMTVDQQRGSQSRIKICLSVVAVEIHKRTYCGGHAFICSCRYGLRGCELTPWMLSSPVVQHMVCVGCLSDGTF